MCGQQMMNGKQFAVLWCEDDLKISQKDKTAVDQLLWFIDQTIKKCEDSFI